MPHQDGTNDFIFADLALSPCVNCAARQVSQDTATCSLPQIAFHIALGTCPRTMGASQRAIELANATIRGAVLVLNPKRVRVLPPPEGKRKGNRHQRHHHSREHRGRQGCPQWQQQGRAIKKEQMYRLCPEYSDIKILAPEYEFINDAATSSTAT